MTSRFPIVEETRGLVKKENELCAQIIRNLQTIYDQKIHMAMAYPSLFNFCVEELKMSPSSAQRRCDAVKLSQSVPDLVKKIEDGLVSVSRVAEVSRYIRHEQREAGRVLPPAEVREIFSKAAEVSNDLEARKVLMTQTAAPIHSIPDRRRVVAGGRTVLEFEVDEEFLDLFDAVQNLHSHKGKRKMGEFLKDVFKDQLQYKHPAFKREAKKNIRIQSALPLEFPGYNLNPAGKTAKTMTPQKLLVRNGVVDGLEFKKTDSSIFKPERFFSSEIKNKSLSHENLSIPSAHNSNLKAVKLDSKKSNLRSAQVANTKNAENKLTNSNGTNVENLEFDNLITQNSNRASNTQLIKLVSYGSEKLGAQILGGVGNTQSVNMVLYGSRKLIAQELDQATNTQPTNAVSCGSER